MNMGSDSTLIAVAAIPPRIWEQDKATWKAWYESLRAGMSSKQQYKRFIADFLHEINKSIAEITEQEIDAYERELSPFIAPSTVNNRLYPIRAYWRFAHRQHEEATK